MMEDIYQIYSHAQKYGYTQVTPYINALDVLDIQQAINQMPLCENYKQGSVSITRIDAYYKTNNRIAYVIRVRGNKGYFVVINADTSFFVKQIGVEGYQPLQSFRTF